MINTYKVQCTKKKCSNNSMMSQRRQVDKLGFSFRHVPSSFSQRIFDYYVSGCCVNYRNIKSVWANAYSQHKVWVVDRDISRIKSIALSSCHVSIEYTINRCASIHDMSCTAQRRHLSWTFCCISAQQTHRTSNNLLQIQTKWHSIVDSVGQ